MMNKKTIYIIICIIAAMNVRAQDIKPDSMPGKAHSDRRAPLVAEISVEDYGYGSGKDSLTIDNLYEVLGEYDVKFRNIVLAQALLETGNFTSSLCLQYHNLFGLRHHSDGSYYEFSTWQESVKAYRDDVQYKYIDGDYYRFLDRIGYAEDRRYTSKVRCIAEKLPWQS